MKSSDGRRGGRGGSRPDRDRPDHRRTALAVEAARIIQEEGLTDFRSAKAKAAERLGLGRNAPLPDNAEIEAALSERTRIFHADRHLEHLAELRSAAFSLMRRLDAFHPRLTGHALAGTAVLHSPVEIHLFSDTAEAVVAGLDALGLNYRSLARRYRLRRDEPELFPGFQLRADGFEFVLAVFPLRLQGHAPLGPVDGRPMRRANLKELAALVGLTAD